MKKYMGREMFEKAMSGKLEPSMQFLLDLDPALRYVFPCRNLFALTRGYTSFLPSYVGDKKDIWYHSLEEIAKETFMKTKNVQRARFADEYIKKICDGLCDCVDFNKFKPLVEK